MRGIFNFNTIKSKIKNEVKSWVQIKGEAIEDKRVLPHFIVTKSKDIVLYILFCTGFVISVNLCAIFTKNFYISFFTFTLKNNLYSKISNTDSVGISVLLVLAVAVFMLSIITLSLFLSILFYDKNIEKNEKMTKLVYGYFLLQALINTNILDSNILSFLNIG